MEGSSRFQFDNPEHGTEETTTPEEAYSSGRLLGSYSVGSLAHPLHKSFALGFRDGARKPGVQWKNVTIIILTLLALAEFIYIIH